MRSDDAARLHAHALNARLAVQRATAVDCDATPHAVELDAVCHEFVAHLDALTTRVSEHAARSLAGRGHVGTWARRKIEHDTHE